MPQKTSPYVEVKYGWNFAESGWNTGMDENLLKFSFLLNSSIDGITETLPVGANGQAYFVPTDKRVYFYINNLWNSTPIPLWYELKLKSDGSILVFDGTALVPASSQTQLTADYNLLVNQVEGLAPLDSPVFTGNPKSDSSPSLTELDSLSTVATVLRAINTLSIKVVGTVSELLSLDPLVEKSVFVTGYHTPLDGGGGFYQYVEGNATTNNGGTIISGWTLNYANHINVKQFGAKGDNIADDTVAIQQAVASVSEGVVYFPAGKYLLSSAIGISSAGVTLVGDSRYSTVLRQTSPSSGIVDVSGWFFTLRGIGLEYTDTPTGGVAINITNSWSILSEFVIRNSYLGVRIGGGVGHKVSNFEILDYESCGLLCENSNDVMVNNFIIDAGVPERGTLGGIRLFNFVEAFVCSSGDVLRGAISLSIDATSYTLANRPAYNTFTDVFFDSSVNGSILEKCVETSFIGCWFSSGRIAGNPQSGCSLGQTEDITFTGCKFFNCGGSGLYVTNQSVGVSLVNCTANSNSVVAGDGVSHGLEFAGGCTKFTVTNCRSTNGLYTGKQGYGLFLGAGCSQYLLSGNDLIGNFTGSIGGDVSGGVVSDNKGFTTKSKGQTTVVVGQSVSLVNHGLSAAPAASDITVTPISSLVSSGIQNYYVANIGATTFEIATNTPVTGTNMNFSWKAACKDTY